MSDATTPRPFKEQYYNSTNPWGPDGSTPGNAYSEGYKAHMCGVSYTRRPPYPIPVDIADWKLGWADAKRDVEYVDIHDGEPFITG